VGTRKILALAVAVALVGCAGGRRRGRADWAVVRNAPWDTAVTAPADPAVPLGFAKGTVTSVSADGLTLEIAVHDGAAREGDLLVVVLSTPPDPAPRNFSDEIRERRVATARVVAVGGDACRAELLRDRRNTTVMPGDKVTIRTP
jgi:hypothetical protein